MNAIVGLSSLLLKGRLPAEERAWAEGVKASADGLLRIIDDVLDFSKIEAGKLVIETLDFRLRETLDGVIGLLGPRALGQGIELRLEVADAVPRWLQGDPTRLRQVLLNLVGNAIKFTAEGHVALSVEPGRGSGDELEIRFVVRDTGVGISPEVQQTLFSPFTQADSSTTRRYGGTGLGLAISQRIVAQLGGEIEVESLPGEGSTFTATLPFTRSRAPTAGASSHDRAAATSGEQPVAGAQRRRGYRVLVAEDDEINRLVVLRVLGDLGFRAEAVGNGRDVLAALERAPFDLVLMDCQMPVLDGYQTTRRIRRGEGDGRHLPIVAVTAHALKGERERCLAAGMDDYVSKPFTEEGLAAVLDRWLGGPRAAPATVAAIPRLAPRSKLRPRTIEIFLSQRSRKLEALRRSLDENDVESLAAVAHGMIGNAGFIGAARLSSMFRALEQSARRGDLAECRRRLPEVEAEYRRVDAELTERLAAQRGGD